MPFDKILEDGTLIHDNNYIKIIKVNPINYELKSTLEKEAILNSYKLFLKVCDFDLQILIQSKKEDLTSYISLIENQFKEENNLKLEEISQKYIEYIQKQNRIKNSSSKNFYILITEKLENPNNENNDNNIRIIHENLKDKYFKIKESLSRCGNLVFEIETRKEVEKILYSFCNLRKSLKIIS